MGNQGSKDNIAVAQAQINTGDLSYKINCMAIVMLLLAILVTAAIIYGIRQHCHRRVKSWLRREMTLVNVGPPVVRVQTVPQQPASAAAAPAGVATAYM